MPNDRIALRPDGSGALDDVVVRDVSMFRAELMSRSELWMCCYFPGSDQRIAFSVRARGGRLEFTETETPHGDQFTYEPVTAPTTPELSPDADRAHADMRAGQRRPPEESA